MAESKPIVENGFEFIAAVEDEWICFNRPVVIPSGYSFRLQRDGLKALLFSVFDTFGIYIKIFNASGKRV